MLPNLINIILSLNTKKEKYKMLVIGLFFFLQTDLFAAVDCGNANLAVEK